MGWRCRSSSGLGNEPIGRNYAGTPLEYTAEGSDSSPVSSIRAHGALAVPLAVAVVANARQPSTITISFAYKSAASSCGAVPLGCERYDSVKSRLAARSWSCAAAGHHRMKADAAWEQVASSIHTRSLGSMSWLQFQAASASLDNPPPKADSALAFRFLDADQDGSIGRAEFDHGFGLCTLNFDRRPVVMVSVLVIVSLAAVAASQVADRCKIPQTMDARTTAQSYDRIGQASPPAHTHNSDTFAARGALGGMVSWEESASKTASFARNSDAYAVKAAPSGVALGELVGRTASSSSRNGSHVPLMSARRLALSRNPFGSWERPNTPSSQAN